MCLFYDTDYDKVAEHFNTLHELKPILTAAARNFVRYCEKERNIKPENGSFDKDFSQVVS